MSLQRVTIEDILNHPQGLAQFDAVIDARSPAEFALDHLPGALNWPTLDNAQRHDIGTTYKQRSAFEARRHGAVLAARNIANHVELHCASLPREWRAVVYCWRGGQRSGALATVLAAIGYPVAALDGGYRAFRRAVVDELERRPAELTFKVLCAPTGSGKSRLLAALKLAGAQVLDLEGLASHRGSVLGLMPGQVQPGQKAFETQLWHALRNFDPARVVWVESESRTIGRLRVPDAVLLRMRAAPCVVLNMPLAHRVALLMEDYGHFVTDSHGFCERLQALVDLRGAATVAHWQARVQAGAHPEVVHALLQLHYDPQYHSSLRRNYTQLDHAQELALANGDINTLTEAAIALSAGAT